ncbi:MAG: EF2563 family selenium-dependent molybdenum hydroxylase system protein [Selenomonadaceae bacterium]|nr:EF2563 family selenium-dependent molybdenum hydroxylase system protein [Selenomonadaceae bacterium]
MKRLIAIRGAGELATASAIYLHLAGFRVLMLEIKDPTSTRREVSFADAAYDGKKTIARVTCHLANSVKEAEKRLKNNEVVMLIDKDCKCLSELKPKVLIDGIIAHENKGTKKGMADYVMALGPGFCAGKDVDAVVEIMRGHDLGSIIYEGYSYRDQGKLSLVDAGGAIGEIIYAEESGDFKGLMNISEKVKKGDLLGKIEATDGRDREIRASADGVLRGIARTGAWVEKGRKVIEINPQMTREECFTLTDKARCVAGAVLLAVSKYMASKRSKFSIEIN